MAAQPPLLARRGEEESLGNGEESARRRRGQRRGGRGWRQASTAGGGWDAGRWVGDSGSRKDRANKVEHFFSRPLSPARLPAVSPLKPSASETLRTGPIVLFFLCFFQKQAKNSKISIYIGKCLYICDFLPKIKVGRPPYLALWGASPLYSKRLNQ